MNRLLLKTILFVIFTLVSISNFIFGSVGLYNSNPDQTSQLPTKTEEGTEYVIITYNEPGFVEKLMELQQFRIAQGISTTLITTTEIGGNSVDTIKNYIKEAYTSWDIPPNVILLVGDHDKIPGPSYQSGQKQKTDISDNYYVDIDGDDLPEMTIARLPINDLFNLSNYIDRIMAYETSPPDYPGYYDHPVTSMSWTNDSQNMFNAEVLNGFFSIGMNKEPLRENDLLLGTVGSSWFVDPTLIDYFGPEGLNYIPATPEYLTDWSGNAVNINANLNSGAFMMVNLDHGTELGWSSPEYWKSDIPGINSADPFFIISINDLNGKFNWSFDCFAEGLINYPYGAAGVIASTTNINNDVSSVYYFNLIDALWDNFIPDVNGGDNIYPFTLPAFANTNAKYQLATTSLPDIESTIYGYHYFGEPFTPIYFSYPETLNVVHDDTFDEGNEAFEVSADSGATICLSQANKILATGSSTANPILFDVDSLNCGDTLFITVTKQNFIRYLSFAICNSVTHISDKDKLNTFHLFPNPADDVVRINFENPMDNPIAILIYNYTGELVREIYNISDPFHIERKNLPAGIYIIQIKVKKTDVKCCKLIFE